MTTIAAAVFDRKQPNAMREQSEDRVSWHLDNWAVWMRGKSTDLDFPSRVAIIGKSGYSDFDAMVASVDTRCAVALDAMIEDLPRPQHIAVYQVMLASVYRLRDDPVVLFELAKETLRKGLTLKGIW